MSDNIETLLNDVIARIETMSEGVKAENLRGMIQGLIDERLSAPDLTRKLKHDTGDARLVGSKFSRWGLSVSDIEFLYDMMESTRTKGGHGPSDELRGAFNALSEAQYLPDAQVREIDKQAIDGLFPRVHRGNEAQYQRAMDTAESGYGSQLIGAQYVGELWEAARPASRVFSLINTFEMTAPTTYLPVEVDFPELLLVGESTAYNSSNYTTVKTGSNRVSVAAKKFVLHQMWSGEMEEDSIIPFVPFLRRQIALSMAHYMDSLILNGDTTDAGSGNINLDDADPDATKHYLAFDGLRHVGLVDNTNNQLNNQGAAITFAKLIGAKKRLLDRTYLHDWGHPNNPNDLVYVTTPEDADKIALLDEVITIDKYGSAATVLTGEVLKVGRHPLITSVAMSLTEADGKVSTTGSNNTLGQIVTFNRNGYVAGWRRRIKIETERIIGTDQSRIVCSLRMGFGRFYPTGAASGIESADVIYNILV